MSELRYGDHIVGQGKTFTPAKIANAGRHEAAVAGVLPPRVLSFVEQIFATGSCWGWKLIGPEESPADLVQKGYTASNNPVMQVLNGTKDGIVVPSAQSNLPQLGKHLAICCYV